MNDSRATIIEAYRALLGRDPESEHIIYACQQKGSMAQVIYDIANSAEAAQRRPAFSPLWHHASTFDAQETLRRHAVSDLLPTSGLVTNFLGLKVEELFCMFMLEGRAGSVEPIPAPSNWHADIAEWAAALRAVDLADKTFSVAELGCGWGCWIFNTGLAARNAGKWPSMVGVEGDEGHIAFAWRCASHNGFSEREVTMHHGAAAPRNGTALFPRQYAPGGSWGLEPEFGADEARVAEARASGRWDVLKMITLDDVVGDRARLDLLHVDIQGGEADLIEQSREIIDSRVAYMVIGTHSRIIEGRIEAALKSSPWRLEVERPAIITLHPSGPVTRIDGVQGWRNMALSPDSH